MERGVGPRVRAIESPFVEVIPRCLAADPARGFGGFSALREAIKSAVKAADIPAIDFIVAPGFKGSFEDYINRGRSYLVLGRYERALSILDRAVEHAPGSYASQVAPPEPFSPRGQLEPA